MAQSGFDPVAGDYDRQFSHTAVGRLQRAVVQRYLTPVLHPGMKVLELNCGTGEDALWLARQGCLVRATDIAPEMVRVTAEKARDASLQHRIEAEVVDIRDLRPDGRKYDLLFSDFGGLNCLSPEEMRQFGGRISNLLHPGGLFVAVVMGRFCWWESVYFALKGNPAAAVRRWRSGPVAAALSPGVNVDTWYYAPGTFRRFFPDLRLQTVQPVGFWLPPSYLNPFFARRTGLLRQLNVLEQKCRGRLWAFAADHYLIVLGR
ncbi:MAG: class I SAM-dependent methyltransferase [Bacteroidetes bacterium]|nr:MAG: class I SAM-dependent methyltransferase [Bacteroidota bacterium]